VPRELPFVTGALVGTFIALCVTAVCLAFGVLDTDALRINRAPQVVVYDLEDRNVEDRNVEGGALRRITTPTDEVASAADLVLTNPRVLITWAGRAAAPATFVPRLAARRPDPPALRPDATTAAPGPVTVQRTGGARASAMFAAGRVRVTVSTRATWNGFLTTLEGPVADLRLDLSELEGPWVVIARNRTRAIGPEERPTTRIPLLPGVPYVISTARAPSAMLMVGSPADLIIAPGPGGVQVAHVEHRRGVGAGGDGRLPIYVAAARTGLRGAALVERPPARLSVAATAGGRFLLTVRNGSRSTDRTLTLAPGTSTLAVEPGAELAALQALDGADGVETLRSEGLSALEGGG
jgi:hypothetical protein